MSDKPDYKNTLNLPQTDFAMKANLSQSEPASLARWDAMGLYDRLERERADAPHFRFHDGPPYANGPIHVGHMVNKVLKDIVVRSRLISPREAARLMGLPDDYPLPASQTAALHLLGDGVASPVVRWLSEHLLAPLAGLEPRRRAA